MGIFPWTANPARHVTGSLRLLISRFGLGLLLASQHLDISPPGMRLVEEAHQLSM